MNPFVRDAYDSAQGTRIRTHNRRCHRLDVIGYRIDADGFQHLITIKRVAAKRAHQTRTMSEGK